MDAGNSSERAKMWADRGGVRDGGGHYWLLTIDAMIHSFLFTKKTIDILQNYCYNLLVFFATEDEFISNAEK